MSTVLYERALYYPHIHLRDEGWLKTAALYYEKLHRIVPADVRPDDSEVFRQLQDELELFENLSPGEEVEEIAPDFIAFAREYLSPSKKKGSFLFGRRARPERIDEEVERVKSNFANADWYRIHPAKMAPALNGALRRLKLAREAPGDIYHDIDLEPVTGALYMRALAERMAAERALPIVTDKPLYQSLLYQAGFVQADEGSGKKKKGIIRGGDKRQDDSGFSLASVVINTVVPRSIHQVPIEKIIKFRRRHNDERRNFYNEVNRLSQDLSGVSEPQSLEACINQRHRAITQSVNNLRMSLEGLGIITTTSLFSMSAPAWLKADWAAPVVNANPVVIPGAVAIAASIVFLNSWLERRKLRRENPYAYVLSIERELNADEFLRSLWRGSALI